MVKQVLATACIALVSLKVLAAPPVRTMYVEAMAREAAVRAALADESASDSVLKLVRTVVASYESIVRRHPTSSYCDNALWQGGRLALDAFERFGEPLDRATGIRLLRFLAAEYPTSKLARQVPQILGPSAGSVSASNLKAKALEGTAPPAPAPRLVLIKAIRRAVLPEAVRVTIELDAEVPSFHEERLAGPARIFVDFPSTRAVSALVDQTLRFEGDADIVRQVRIGRHPNATTRIVLDDALVARLATRGLVTDWRNRLPSVSPRAAAAIADAFAPVVADRPADVPPAPPQAGPLGIPPQGPLAASSPLPRSAPNLAAAPSMARQLGLGVSRIVIDPGHGGHDPGAQGKGVTEAELVLDVSQRLQKLLEKVRGVEVILTRQTDDFVPLQERTAIANREAADLFLSIHANASANSQARGIETYFLNFANNLSAAAVAARENAASGQAMGALPDFVKAIALNNKLDESRDFATRVQHEMVDRLRATNKTVKNLGVKQAPFVVLIGASMPSVLAEISFLTNVQEAKLLKSGAYRQRIAEALFSAIRTYQTSLTKGQTVAER
jgi:N-acetylmuramoyl-L-alanine amidase